jgi:quinol-cytochrome oxidoreductase complex cytochrome b subunit
LHIYFLPTLIVLLMAVHIWRVRKDGFAVSDRESDEREAGREPVDREVSDVRS